MIRRLWFCSATFAVLAAASHAPAATCTRHDGGLLVTGKGYRVSFTVTSADFAFELPDGQGGWRPVCERIKPQFAFAEGRNVWASSDVPCAFEHAERDGAVVVGMTALLQPLRAIGAKVHFICTDLGVLVRFAASAAQSWPRGKLWAMPRLMLDHEFFDSYTFWRAPDENRSGRLDALGKQNVYAGVSAWGQDGDVCRRLSRVHPAIIARSEQSDAGWGVVFVDYDAAWSAGHMFIQRHRPGYVYLYSGLVSPAAAGEPRWAWLAPFPGRNASACTSKVEQLLAASAGLVRGFRPVAPPLGQDILRPVSDFPPELRRAEPVSDINDAVVYTINEGIRSNYGIELAEKVGSDVLVRAWFKWYNALDWSRMTHLPPKAHALGALFGGGLTCSALYHGENGLSEAQVLDMATRGPDGQLVDAWDTPGCRHGTLSNPKYLEYLLSWARKQIDAGADYLFMDEVNAALRRDEGFDDYSLADFRKCLLRTYGDGQGWTAADARWAERFKIDLADRAQSPDGTIGTFDYRAYLSEHGLVRNPWSSQNPLAADYRQSRKERDDRAWKWLTDEMRAYAASQGRRVLISGNGLEKHVDLQVLGVWGDWVIKDGRVDFAESQMQAWASKVRMGRWRAGKRVPVVFFHDWGFNGFPWMKVTPAERVLWTRIRGAEIYAAGAFFAFPILGPAGCDALRDGTIRTVARQTAFYQRHRDLYLNAELLSIESAQPTADLLSASLWRRAEPPALVVHLINRQVEGTSLRRRQNVGVVIPTHSAPRSLRVVSPDWEDERSARTEDTADGLRVTLPVLDAYAVAALEYDALPSLKLSAGRITPSLTWARPEVNEFAVDHTGTVDAPLALNGFLQGQLHPHLRNPPTFVVNAIAPVKLLVKVRAVATLGARIECRVDQKLAGRVELPDLDHKNDGGAPEYARVLEFDVPTGHHRVSVSNTGGDWATVAWYCFVGELGD